MAETSRMKTLEDRVDKLENEFISSGLDKDRRIDDMHQDMLAIHTDMGAMKKTIEDLTAEIKCAVQSLKQIATNTTNMHELASLYEKWKGFSWVMKNLGFWGAILIAFILGIVAAIVKTNV